MSSTNNDLTLTGWEIKILKCIKTKAKTEKKIAKEVTLNMSVVSPIITDLMLRGFIQRTRRAKMHISSREYFFATIEGITALEATRRGNSMFWSQVASLVNDNIERMIFDLSERSLPFRLILGSFKASYKIGKFILK